MRRLCKVLMLAGLTFAPSLVFAQSAPATQVIVDVFPGVNPATVAAKYGIVPEQVFTEIANAFTAEVTAGPITRLKADADVQQVTADGIVGRIPRTGISLTPPGVRNVYTYFGQALLDAPRLLGTSPVRLRIATD